MSFSLRRSLRTNVLFKYANLFLAVASGILLVPFYLQHLSIQEYGAWLAVGSFASWFAVIDPGIANLLIQKISYCLGEGNKQALVEYVIAGLINAGFVAFVVLILGYYSAPEIVRWLNLKEIDTNQIITAFQLSVASTSVMIFAFASIGIIQGMHRSFAAGLLVFLGGISRIIMVVIFLLNGCGLQALPRAEFSSAIFVLVCSLLILAFDSTAKLSDVKINFDRLREFIALFAYSFGARLGKIITGSLDNVLIARLIGAEQVAVYSLTATAPRQAENLINQPIAAFRPTLAYLSANASINKLAEYIERLLRWVVWLSGWGLAGLGSLSQDFVHLWVGAENIAGTRVALALALLFWMRVWTNSTGTIGFSLGDIRRNSLGEWVYSLMLIPALIAGAMVWGLLGIAVAHIAVQLLTMAWYFPWSIWRHMQWRGEKTIAFLTEGVFSFIAAFLAYLSCPQVKSWLQFMFAGLTVTLIYLVVLGLMSFSFRQEIRAQMSILRRAA